MRRYRFIHGILLAALAVVLLAVPVLAAYYAEITVTESDGNSYDMLPVIADINIDYLADNNFIEPDGRDVRIKTGSGAEVPFMLKTDQVIFASSIGNDRQNAFRLSTGNSLLDDFDIVSGDGGYVTIADNADLELANDFEIEIDGYIDTTTAGNIVDKPNALDIDSDGAGNIDVQLWKPTEIIQNVASTFMPMYNGNPYRAGQRIDDFPATTITSVSFWLEKDNNPTGTAYARARRVSDDAIIGTFGSILVSTLPETPATWITFSTPVYNPTEQDIRLLIEWGSGDGDNHISCYYATSDYIDGKWCYYEGSYTEQASFDTTIKYTSITDDGIYLTATVSQGSHTVLLTADGTDITLNIDGDDKDTESLAGASIYDSALDWTLGGSVVPYMSYFKLTTSDTLRITYDPDDIISGTTLINETDAGTYDGTITYGSNPAGITVNMSGLETYETSYPTDAAGSQDIIRPTTAPLFDVDLDRLSHNPIQPIVALIADTANLTERLVWLAGAFVLLFVILLVVLWKTEGQITFTAFAGLGFCIIVYILGIFPLWTIIVFAIGAVAALVWERVIAL